MHKITLRIVLVVVVTTLPLYADKASVAKEAECSDWLLVSNWKNNNVKIFDECSGQFVRELDKQGLIDGPLGILETPDGDVLVVSENNSRLIKFDRETLSSGNIVMEAGSEKRPFIEKPSGAVLARDGFLYVSSYGTNEIVKIDPATWTIVEHILKPGNNHIKGIDAGMQITSDNYLLVPGYDSDNIIRINLNNHEVTQFVPTGTEGLDAPRTILLREKEKEMLVTGERSNNIMVFNLETGAYLRTVAEVARPTGLIADDENHLIVNNHDTIFRVDYQGKTGQKLIPNGSGGLDSGTFVYRLDRKRGK